MGCPPVWQWPKSKWQGPLMHQPQWWEKAGRVPPWIIFWVFNTSIKFPYSALSGHGSTFPPDGTCYPWTLPLNQRPCSHLLLCVTTHHRHSSKERQE